MKRAHIYMSILGLVAAVSGKADDIPKAFNFDRYQGMMDRSPFAVATAVVAPAATPDFAKDLYVANAARSPDGDLVTIASSSDKNFKKYLTTKEPVDGYSVANIEWSEKVGATRVTISKDGKFATLTFNQALLAQPAPNAPPPPAAVPNVPPSLGIPTPAPGGGMPGQTTYPKPAPIPSLPPSRVRGVIQKNPGTAPAPTEITTPPPRTNEVPES